MKALIAAASMLAGVLGTHLDLGRRLDGLTARVEELSVRIDHVEKPRGEERGKVK